MTLSQFVENHPAPAAGHWLVDAPDAGSFVVSKSNIQLYLDDHGDVEVEWERDNVLRVPAFAQRRALYREATLKVSESWDKWD